MYLLTGAKCPSKAQAVEVVTLAVLSPHPTKLICMAGALSTQAVASPTADRDVLLWGAVIVIGWIVVFHRALAMRAQAALVTLTHAAFVGPVAVATEGAVGLCLCFTFATTGKVHRDLQGILEAQRFDGKSSALLLRAATQLSLHAE